jgi:hypothetical protein
MFAETFTICSGRIVAKYLQICSAFPIILIYPMCRQIFAYTSAMYTLAKILSGFGAYYLLFSKFCQMFASTVLYVYMSINLLQYRFCKIFTHTLCLNVYVTYFSQNL